MTTLPAVIGSSNSIALLIIIGPWVYPLGSIVIALVRLSVSPSVFKYLRDRSLVFSETLHEVRGQLSKKSDTAEILKKNLNPGIKGD